MKAVLICNERLFQIGYLIRTKQSRETKSMTLFPSSPLCLPLLTTSSGNTRNSIIAAAMLAANNCSWLYVVIMLFSSIRHSSHDIYSLSLYIKMENIHIEGITIVFFEEHSCSYFCYWFFCGGSSSCLIDFISPTTGSSLNYWVLCSLQPATMNHQENCSLLRCTTFRERNGIIYLVSYTVVMFLRCICLFTTNGASNNSIFMGIIPVWILLAKNV